MDSKMIRELEESNLTVGDLKRMFDTQKDQNGKTFCFE